MVNTIKGDPVSHTDVSVDQGGTYNTTDTGKFEIERLPPGVGPGHVVKLTVAGWYIVAPNDGGSGRVYFPAAQEQPLPVRVARKGDSATLLSDASIIRDLLFERFFRLETDEKATSNLRREAAFIMPTVVPVSWAHNSSPQIRPALAQPQPLSSPFPGSNKADNEEFTRVKAQELGVPPEDLQKAIEIWIKQADDPYERALAALYVGDYKAAAEYASNSKSPTAKREFERNVVLSHALFRLGRFEDATQAINHALGLHPEDPVLKSNLFVVRRASAPLNLRNGANTTGDPEAGAVPSITSSSSDRAHELGSKAASHFPASCPKSGMTLQVCHDRFPDGCSASAHPSYDAYLDFLKDQDPGPTLSSTKDLTGSDLPKLESQLPTTLRGTNHATFAKQFANLGEGNIHTVIGYLYFAEDTSKGTPTIPPNSETSNCKLTAPNTFDYHLGLGFDSTLAAKALSTHPKPGDAAFSTLEKQSVVAEMTPYTRHAKWTFSRVNALQGQQVKVVGQLMVDNIHFNKKDDCHFSPPQSSCWRSTVWEIHPITQFYVCNSSGGCTASSPASDWTNLDDMP